VVWRALKTEDLNVARQRLPAEMLKAKSPSIQSGQSLSLRELLSTYEERLGILAARTIANHKAIVAVFRSTWSHSKDAKVGTISTAMLEEWLASHKKRLSGVGLNDYLTKFLRPLFRLAVEMNAVESSPADGLRKIREETPIRLTPTFPTALRIIKDVRLQKMNARSRHSADVLELMLKTGCGQGEVAGLRGEHIDFGAGRIWFRRAKTARSYCVPVFPWLKPLIRIMQNAGRIKPGKRVFSIVNPRKALFKYFISLGLPC
jgi:integrase